MATRIASTKEVTVLARGQYKRNAKAVVYLVLSSNGNDQYRTIIYDGKATHCSCPATKPCYHMVQLEAIEGARAEREARAELVRRSAERTAYNYYEMSLGVL